MGETKSLHFTVCGSGLTKLVRDIYLYEEKEKAWNIMGSLDGITIDQSKAVFMGKAKLVECENGTTLSLVYEDDLEWQKEFDGHIKDLAEREKENSFIERSAHEFWNEHPSMTLDEARSWIIDALPEARRSTRGVVTIAKDLLIKSTMAGMSHTRNALRSVQRLEVEAGFDKEIEKQDKIIEKLKGGGDLLEDMQKEANLQIAKAMFISGVGETDSEKKKANNEMIKKFATKMYTFIFEGHQYTFDDSARNQGRCPHCENQAKDGSFFKYKEDGYIGYHDFKQGEVAVCFECQECFEKFYYHYNKEHFLEMIKEDEEE